MKWKLRKLFKSWAKWLITSPLSVGIYILINVTFVATWLMYCFTEGLVNYWMWPSISCIFAAVFINIARGQVKQWLR
jgi:uncharacterized membrane protein YraQ (UPF0718 family)